MIIHHLFTIIEHQNSVQTFKLSSLPDVKELRVPRGKITEVSDVFWHDWKALAPLPPWARPRPLVLPASELGLRPTNEAPRGTGVSQAAAQLNSCPAVLAHIDALRVLSGLGWLLPLPSGCEFYENQTQHRDSVRL